MMLNSSIAWAAIGLLMVTALAQWALEWLNQAHVRRHSRSVPEAFRQIMDEATYQKSVGYTLAKSRLHQIEVIWGFLVLVSILASGVLPALLGWLQSRLGISVWCDVTFLCAAGFLLAIPGLPLEWWEQFRLEERFGFNTTTPRTWWLDHVKATCLSLLLGYPLLVLVLKCVEWTGAFWWVWAWVAVMGFQLVMVVLAPLVILPLFNKFTPLPEGSLRDRLLALSRRTGFATRSVQVMDGSRRSRHSNAFFTGFGRFRKIALFDTLIEQLSEPELESVLAHEIGHFKRGHIPQRLAVSALGMLAVFWCVAWLARQPAFASAFGFPADHVASTLLLVAILASAVGFWLTPLSNLWSRRHEYQADAFAARAMGTSESLVTALRKLNEKNLGNLTPHPLYSGVHYSHPTLLERETALGQVEATSQTRS